MGCHKCIFIFQIRYSEELGVSAEKASRLFIYQGLCSSAGRLLSGFLCNHPRVDTFKVYQAAQFTAGLSTILMTAVPTFTTLTICMVFYGLGDGFFYTSLSVLTFTASPLKSAAVLGWYMTISALFLASGPPLAGKCHENYRYSFGTNPRIRRIGYFRKYLNTLCLCPKHCLCFLLGPM